MEYLRNIPQELLERNHCNSIPVPMPEASEEAAGGFPDVAAEAVSASEDVPDAVAAVSAGKDVPDAAAAVSAGKDVPDAVAAVSAGKDVPDAVADGWLTAGRPDASQIADGMRRQVPIVV